MWSKALLKILVEAGIGSRRRAADAVMCGLVRVNGGSIHRCSKNLIAQIDVVGNFA